MNRIHQGVGVLLIALASHASYADGARQNRGDDPFFQVSHAVADCPTPLGPLYTEEEWTTRVHYRVEDGNSCWWEGRCRLSNAYQYDHEIVEAVQRRLAFINRSTGWREHTALWLTLQRRFIIVQGCVSADFDKKKFLFELAKTADVQKVIDETTGNPKASTLPYRTLAHPDVLPPEPK